MGTNKVPGRTDMQALLRVDGVVGGGRAIGSTSDGLLVEKVTWWPALGHAQNTCAKFPYIPFLPHRNGDCRLGYGLARYAAELSPQVRWKASQLL